MMSSYVLRPMYVQGYRATQQAIVEATEQAAEVDQMKGATLEEISHMVDQISREYRSKQAQLQPLTQELKVNPVLQHVVELLYSRPYPSLHMPTSEFVHELTFPLKF
jgi:type I site-specific restriction endonuclease